MLLLALALLAIEDAPAPPPPIHNYLKGAAPRERCGERAASGEVVVCGRAERDARYRIDPAIPAGVVPVLPEASVALGPGTLAVHGAQAGMPQGAVATRVMVTVTLPF